MSEGGGNEGQAKSGPFDSVHGRCPWGSTSKRAWIEHQITVRWKVDAVYSGSEIH